MGWLVLLMMFFLFSPFPLEMSSYSVSVVPVPLADTPRLLHTQSRTEHTLYLIQSYRVAAAATAGSTVANATASAYRV